VLKKIEQHGWRSMNWKNGFTMLHWAAGKGNHEICRYLLELNGDARAADGNNRSPLDIATDRGDTELVAILTSKRKSIFPMSR
jgi:ankyrin repeat protein